MAGNRTFTIIKPNAVANNNIGNICAMIEKAGFRIIAMKMTYLSRSDAEKFYYVHKGRFFFRNLYLFMTSGPIVVMVLEKENAVEDFRKLIGSTNPEMAAEGTIRKLYAQSKTRNAIHASDSDENAAWEASFFFSDKEIIDTEYCLPLPEDEIDSD
ncbi:Nucleoside diphosphate kinase [Mucinivorans hirudinis]|uniref:Nucleoside diphosphate kinase n=1 Tax=Mucinivorans hirudinis TaxID=1433126 RepID=A0A060R9V6_9BACT|nr:Nucleoside diphosphate kinase [Mucinivorans hirudinis]